MLAMLLAALAATVAATLFADQQRWMRTVEYRRDQVQAQAIVMAGVQWARQILYEDSRTSTIDHLSEPWAMSLPPIPIENGAIRGSIVDAQGRLNVNDLGATGTDLAAAAGAHRTLVRAARRSAGCARRDRRLGRPRRRHAPRRCGGRVLRIAAGARPYRECADHRAWPSSGPFAA